MENQFRFYVNGVRQQTMPHETRRTLSRNAVEAANRYYQTHPSEYARFAKTQERGVRHGKTGD